VARPTATYPYNVIDLGTLPARFPNQFTASIAVGVNNKGQVVGSATSPALGCAAAYAILCEAFLYSDGTITGLGTLDGRASTGTGINDKGDVVGWSGGQNFLFTKGIMTGITGTVSQDAYINNKGQIASTVFSDSNDWEAILYDKGRISRLGKLGALQSYASRINNHGDVVGYTFSPYQGSGPPCASFQAFLYDGGKITGLGALGGSGSFSFAYGVNDKGQVVGTSSRTPCGHGYAFLYDGGAMVDLGTLAGYDTSSAQAINKGGEIVGYAFSNTAGFKPGTEAFLYSNGVMTDIGPPGWSNTIAMDINDHGQIVGYGINPVGQQHGFLLDPVKSPKP
jgi:probable HAF family extracellular repeat protein